MTTNGSEDSNLVTKRTSKCGSKQTGQRLAKRSAGKSLLPARLSQLWKRLELSPLSKRKRKKRRLIIIFNKLYTSFDWSVLRTVCNRICYRMAYLLVEHCCMASNLIHVWGSVIKWYFCCYTIIIYSHYQISI